MLAILGPLSIDHNLHLPLLHPCFQDIIVSRMISLSLSISSVYSSSQPIMCLPSPCWASAGCKAGLCQPRNRDSPPNPLAQLMWPMPHVLPQEAGGASQHEQTDEQTDEEMDEQTIEQTRNKQANKQTNEKLALVQLLDSSSLLASCCPPSS